LNTTGLVHTSVSSLCTFISEVNLIYIPTNWQRNIRSSWRRINPDRIIW